MSPSPQVTVLVATIGSAGAMAFTLLYYAQRHNDATPGGHWPLALGAVVVGLFSGVGGHLVSPAGRRAVSTAIATGLLGAAFASFLLFATLIWTYGA